MRIVIVILTDLYHLLKTIVEICNLSGLEVKRWVLPGVGLMRLTGVMITGILDNQVVMGHV